MPRIVRHHQTGPIKIDPNAPPGDPTAWPRDEQGNLKKISICACGLSARFPFCDGAHKCLNEDPGHVYRYDPQTREVIDKRPEPPASP
ncbi:MAG: CDGSH iron-sulfur domain-containing protein [Phycisphaerales bacterium]|nr:CDGSH iron-sulfur domain-containing protein [Phycisphaerales bacterium]